MALELYTWATPNGHKPQILLEELGVEYDVRPVNIFDGEQFTEAFGKLNPNRRIPVLVDSDGDKSLTVFESGAIMLHLADKFDRFISKDPYTRSATLQWLMWQMGGLGPMFGQGQHFSTYAREKHQYSIDRYTKEGERLLMVMETQLSQTEYLAGDYSIADIACFPWIRVHKMANLSLEGKPNVQNWYGKIRNRAAVDRGLNVLREVLTGVPDTDHAHDIMFGKSQFKNR